MYKQLNANKSLSPSCVIHSEGRSEKCMALMKGVSISPLKNNYVCFLYEGNGSFVSDLQYTSKICLFRSCAICLVHSLLDLPAAAGPSNGLAFGLGEGGSGGAC